MGRFAAELFETNDGILIACHFIMRSFICVALSVLAGGLPLEGRHLSQPFRSSLSSPSPLAAAELHRRIAEQTQVLNQMRSEIEKKEEERVVLENSLDKLSDELEDQQSLIQNLEEKQQNQTDQFYKNYTSQNLEDQRQKVNQEYRLSQLQSQINQGQNTLRYLKEKITQQESLGFETDLLISLRGEYQSALSRVQQMQTQFWNIKNQAGEAEVLDRVNRQREFQNEFQNLQKNYQNQIAAEKSHYQQLETQYQSLKQKSSEQTALLDELDQKYQTEKSNYYELNAQLKLAAS